jgi:hypothetical protein
VIKGLLNKEFIFADDTRLYWQEKTNVLRQYMIDWSVYLDPDRVEWLSELSGINQEALPKIYMQQDIKDIVTLYAEAVETYTDSLIKVVLLEKQLLSYREASANKTHEIDSLSKKLAAAKEEAEKNIIKNELNQKKEKVREYVCSSNTITSRYSLQMMELFLDYIQEYFYPTDAARKKNIEKLFIIAKRFFSDMPTYEEKQMEIIEKVHSCKQSLDTIAGPSAEIVNRIKADPLYIQRKRELSYLLPPPSYESLPPPPYETLPPPPYESTLPRSDSRASLDRAPTR